MVKKDRQQNGYTLAYPKNKCYQHFTLPHLQKQLTQAQFLLLTILLNLIQSEKQVRLERLVRIFPYPITTESRRRKRNKISRFTSINDRTDLVPINYSLVNPLLSRWTNCVNRDRPQPAGGALIYSWSVSIRERRAIPLYWSLLPKLGNSNLEEQTLVLEQVLPLFKEYKVIVLGEREFCSVDLGDWPRTMGVSFCLRLKKNHCLETENLIWQRLDRLGVKPGTSLYFQGVRGAKNATTSRV